MKVRKIISLVLNLLAVIAAITGMVLIKQSFIDEGPVLFAKFFTLFTNVLIIFTGLISIGYCIDGFIKKKEDAILPIGIFVLRLITSVSALIAFGTVVGYLQYTALANLTPADTLFWNNICHHYVAPLAIIASFIFFDLDKKYPFKTFAFGPIHLLVYMAYAVPICLIDASIWNGAPYVFMDTSKLEIWLIVVLILGFIVVGFLFSMLLWLLNRIVYLIFIGEEVSKEETTPEEAEVQETVEVTEEDQNEVNEIIKTGYTGPRIYHISKREDKMWQVKFATGKKAIKLFPTQAEAIVFAKKLAKSQAGSIRVHSLKGKIRKAH